MEGSAAPMEGMSCTTLRSHQGTRSVINKRRKAAIASPGQATGISVYTFAASFAIMKGFKRRGSMQEDD